MLAWDIAMDPDWSTVDHIWVWHSGGAYFGVPLSNFGGWFLTASLYYLAFALYCKMRPISSQPTLQVFWGLPILLYATCALGNLLLLRQPMAPPIVFDAAGKQWHTGDILVSCILISLLVMTPARSAGVAAATRNTIALIHPFGLIRQPPAICAR